MNLSVLDLASVYEGMSNGEALRQTIATAQEAERLGITFSTELGEAAEQFNDDLDPFANGANRMTGY